MGIEAQPFYFSSGQTRLFGWLHEPDVSASTHDVAAAAPRWGLVLCKPFGYEAVCAHRSLRAWAEASASLGIPALRFDYAGTGDSADLGEASEAEQLATWTGDVGAAIRALRERSHVERIGLLGVRLGATVASLAAAGQSDVQALIAVAPIADGRRYVRELRTLQPRVTSAPESLEVNGFHLSAATVRRLMDIDLTQQQAPPAPRILIIDRSDLPGAARWAGALAGRPVQLRYQALPGYVEMMSTPHASVVPAGMLEVSLQWLASQRAGAGETAAAPAATPASAGRGSSRPAVPDADAAPASAAEGVDREQAAREYLRLRPQGTDATIIERPIFLDAGRTLFAVLSEPVGPQEPAEPQQPAAPQDSTELPEPAEPQEPAVRSGCAAVILLNGGATHHIGPNRMYVSLARRWAAEGRVVLRMDLAGLGDSDTRPGRPQNEVYPPGAVEDVRMARAALERRGPIAALTLVGLCSGAFHSLRCAIDGLPVERILMVNPLTFFWKEGMTLSDLQDAEVLRGPRIYRQRVRSSQSWKKLLSGRVNLRPVLRTLAHRGWLAVDSKRRDLARRLRIHLADDLGWELEDIAARGVQAAFFFARGDPGSALLRMQAGRSLRRLRDRCRIHFVDGADHIFSQSLPRALLERLLEQELVAGPGPAGPLPGAPPAAPRSGAARARPLRRLRAKYLRTAQRRGAGYQLM